MGRDRIEPLGADQAMQTLKTVLGLIVLDLKMILGELPE